MLKGKSFSFLFLTVFVLIFQAEAQVCGTTNIGSQKTVVTSANSGANVGSNVTDNDPLSVWQPIYSSADWAYIDLTQQETVCQVKLKWRYGQFASKFKLQTSNDPANENSWVDIYEDLNNNPSEAETEGAYNTWTHVNTINITSSNNANKRYIRVRVPYIEWAQWRLAEFQVFKQNSTGNSPPTATMTNNTNPAITIAAGTTITLTANATDPDGTISEVSFRYGAGTIIGIAPQTTTGPYTFQWAPTDPGTYQVYAQAKDNLLAIGNSLPITITVYANAGAWSLNGNDLTNVPDPYIGTPANKNFPIVFKTSGSEKMRITTDGKVYIGAPGFPTSVPADALLAVKGFIVSKGLKVTQINWPDYVFEKDYNLMPLPQLADFIKKNKHLPGVPSITQVSKDGVNVGENQEILLRKIEELTLYLLEQNKRIEALQREVIKLKTRKKK